MIDQSRITPQYITTLNDGEIFSAAYVKPEVM